METLDLKSLVLDQSFDVGDILKQMEIPVRTPKKDEFIRVHPEHTSGLVGVYRDLENVHHFVFPQIANLEILDGHVRRVVLRLAVTTDGHYFVWPLRVADKAGNLDEYARTALLAAEQAEKKWVRMQANKQTKSFDRYIAENQSRPEPVWPSESFNSIVTKAFHGNVIDTEGHPLIRKLRGEI
jgi:hypothetical protein